MKVLFVSNCCGFSGAEIVLARMIRNNFFLRPVALVPRGAFSKKLNDIGCKVFLSKGLREISRTNKFWFVSAMLGLGLFIMEYIAVVFREKPSLVHANGYIAGMFCFIPCMISRVRFVLHIHDVFVEGTLESKLCSFLSRRALNVVAVSEAVKRRLVVLGVPEQKIVVVYNGIDCENEFNPKKYIKAKSYKINIGMVGLIVEWKGFHIFLEALERLCSSSDYHAYIIGDSWRGKKTNYKEKIYEMACNPTLSSQVTFMGFCEDIPKALSELDIVVHASTLDDPLPTVVLEGMAMGKIVIASDVGGVREMIEHGVNGYIYQAGDSAELADILNKVISNYEEIGNVRNAARDRIITYFSEDKMTTCMNAVYKRLV